MNDSAQTKRLVDAVVSIAATIAEIINANVKEAASTERWVRKKDVAEHFNVSQRTVDNWMKTGLLAYIRTGRNVRFKLSEAEETMNRCVKVRSR